MTPGPYFEYWSSITGLYVEVKFSSDHSIHLLNPWFPGIVSCLGACILPGQREILEVSATLKKCFKCIARGRCVLSHYPHSSKTQQVVQITENNSNPLSPHKCPALSTIAPAAKLLGCRGWCCSSELKGTHLTCRGLASMLQEQTCTGGSQENN